MKNIILLGAVALFSGMVTAGCSSGVAGTYSKEKSSLTLTLEKNQAFHLSTGGTGSYSVRGTKIIMTNPVYGGTHGEIRGNTLVFPRVASDNMVGQSFTGTWIKQE